MDLDGNLDGERVIKRDGNKAVERERIWYYLSFVDPDLAPGQRWLGAVVVEGDDIKAAIKRSWGLGINPGGEVVCLEVEHLPPVEYRNRLLTKADLHAAGQAMGNDELTDLDGNPIE